MFFLNKAGKLDLDFVVSLKQNINRELCMPEI